MPTSPEVEAEISRRAERRKKDLMEVLGDGIIASTITSSLDKANSAKGVDAFKSFVESTWKFESPRGKEDWSARQRVSENLYPAKPARSVYNSPLIKTDRPSLWRSPPPYADQSFLRRLSSEGNGERCKFYSQAPTTHSPLNSKRVEASSNSPLSSSHNCKLYPSLPGSDPHGVLKSSPEVKDMKEYSNRSTANAMKNATYCLRNFKSSSTSLVSREEVSSSLTSDLTPDLSKNSSNDIEDTYDMDRFLEEALGSALDLNSTMNEEKDSNVPSKDSVSTSNCSLTSSSKYATATLPSSVRLDKARLFNQDLSDEENHLLQEANVQQQLMSQASKALTICRSSKTFFNSASLVDAERLLLLATLRHKAVLDEIKTTASINSGDTSDFRGQLGILEVSIPLKDDPLKWNKTEHERDLLFLCVLSYGRQISASEAVALEPGAKYINFSTRMELLNLPESFVASLQIYSLRTHKPQLSRHKNRINKACQLLRINSKNCLGPSASSEQFLHLRSPAFALSGTVSIDLTMICNSEPQNLRLEKVPLMSPLRGSAWVQMETSLTSSIECSGFLTILEKVGGSHAWQRRWCLLRDLCLKFWNYPADQDEKDPLDTIDLRYCSTETIKVAPRHLCARSRTLMLESTRPSTPTDLNSTLMECNSDITVLRYFLSCDSVQEMQKWANIFDQVLFAIKAWNIKKKDD